jgi:hypothetical protein
LRTIDGFHEDDHDDRSGDVSYGHPQRVRLDMESVIASEFLYRLHPDDAVTAGPA